MKTATIFLFAALLLPFLALGGSQAASQPLVRFGIITDLHHTNKADTSTRKYSCAREKTDTFVKAMDRLKATFVVELGDFVDTLTNAKDPAENLAELESAYTAFNGPAYHVLGNHEFDNLTRADFLKSVTNTGILQGETYYSWDAQGVHFVVLDADYTNKPPHRPFDMNTREDSFWTWKDAFIPAEEVSWLKKDLHESKLPTVVFTHQTMDRVDEQDHNIKNASVVRKVLEDDGQVIAVFSGHDHQGGYSNIQGIHYIVLNGNVGVNDFRPWNVTSNTEGFDAVADNQFSLVEVNLVAEKNVQLKVIGYGRQASYVFESSLK